MIEFVKAKGKRECRRWPAIHTTHPAAPRALMIASVTSPKNGNRRFFALPRCGARGGGVLRASVFAGVSSSALAPVSSISAAAPEVLVHVV